jgi:glycopeptide antibiotics resistance protein
MPKKIVLFLLLLVIGGVFYFSWSSDPSLESETYLPKWLLDWSNYYYNLRTAVPFIAFGYLLQVYTQRKISNKMDANKNLIFIQNLGVAAVVVFIAECGQFLIKNRSPDIMDIYFGIIGSLIGALIYNLFDRLIKK